jgi:hypothetical protein
MQVEVGKVYKCGDGYVYIDYKSQWLEENDSDFCYVGIECGEYGVMKPWPVIGRFTVCGHYSCNNPQALRHIIKEIPKRETITLYGKTYYKDEYEKVAEAFQKAFQKALAGLNEVEQG